MFYFAPTDRYLQPRLLRVNLSTWNIVFAIMQFSKVFFEKLKFFRESNASDSHRKGPAAAKRARKRRKKVDTRVKHAQDCCGGIA